MATKSRKLKTAEHAVVAVATGTVPEASYSSTVSSPRSRNLSGSWTAVGTTEQGEEEIEQFTINHDVRSGGIHGQSVPEEGDDAFVIIDGVLNDRKITFLQKFHDGEETSWCVLHDLLLSLCCQCC